MKKRIFALLLAAMLSLSGCAAQHYENLPQIAVYFAASGENGDSGASVGTEIRTVDKDEDMLKAAAEAVMSTPQSYKLASPFTSGVTLESYKLEDGKLSLHMSDAYAEMPAGKKIIARSCLALTLCAIKGVESVSVFVGDIADITGLTADGIITENTELDPSVKHLRLYFSNGRGLAFEHRTAEAAEDRELAAIVMEELMKGPVSAGLYSTIPRGTRLLSAKVENGLCTLSLSKEFLDNRVDSESGAAMTIYSIVDSLTTLTKVSRVQFLIDDERVDTYANIGIFYPIERKEITG